VTLTKIQKKKTQIKATKTLMKMAQKKDPTNQAAIKTQMKRMEVETTMTQTKTLTKTQMGTPMQVAKRRRAR